MNRERLLPRVDKRLWQSIEASFVEREREREYVGARNAAPVRVSTWLTTA